MRRRKRGARAARFGWIRGFAAAATVAATVPVAVADEYAWEVFAAGERVDIGDVIDGDALSVGATYYFSPIDDSRGPYRLAAFLSRSSRIGIDVRRDETNVTFTVLPPATGVTTFVGRSETDAVGIFGRYVQPRSGWFAGGGFHVGDADPPSSPALQREVDIDGYTVHFGKYVASSTSVELGWSSTETRSEVTVTGCVADPFCLTSAGSQLTVENAFLRVFHVGNVGRLAYSLSGSAAVRRSDEDIVQPVIHGYEVSVDWFFLRNVSAGVSVAHTSNDGPTGDLGDDDHTSLRISGRF